LPSTTVVGGVAKLLNPGKAGVPLTVTCSCGVTPLTCIELPYWSKTWKWTVMNTPPEPVAHPPSVASALRAPKYVGTCALFVCATMSDDAIETLLRYAWPGNVRELRNVIERMVIMNPTAAKLERKHLPPLVYRDGSRRSLSEFSPPAPGARRLRARLHPQEAG